MQVAQAPKVGVTAACPVRQTARHAFFARPSSDLRLAGREAKARVKRDVLRRGFDATAIVTFLADGGRGNEFHQLVYLELEVFVDGRPPYGVRTGEYLTAASAGSVAPGRELVVKVDPQDAQRVAVDWERSLRLR